MNEGYEHPAAENLVERRVVLTAAWAPSERWQLIARIPYSDRQLKEGDEETSSAGLADLELLLRWRIWASDFESGLGRANWISLTFGAKTDWGRDDAREDGELLDQHAQAGTGSTDWLAGVSGVHLLDERSSLYGSLQVRLTGDNDQGYEYGDARLLNAGYERKVAERLDLALEANLRDADADVTGDGDEDPNTGGRIGYLQPRVLVHLGHNLVGRLAAQVPVWKDLDGEQDEKTVWSVGLTCTFDGCRVDAGARPQPRSSASSFSKKRRPAGVGSEARPFPRAAGNPGRAGAAARRRRRAGQVVAAFAPVEAGRGRRRAGAAGGAGSIPKRRSGRLGLKSSPGARWPPLTRCSVTQHPEPAGEVVVAGAGETQLLAVLARRNAGAAGEGGEREQKGDRGRRGSGGGVFRGRRRRARWKRWSARPPRRAVRGQARRAASRVPGGIGDQAGGGGDLGVGEHCPASIVR